VRNLILATLLFASTYQTAVGEQTGDWKYTTENNRATITKYTALGKAVTIPGSLNGNTVTSIGNMAFYECTNLSSVTIPCRVTSISHNAFTKCTNLTSITIPPGRRIQGEMPKHIKVIRK
jgi:hypothetical protein